MTMCAVKKVRTARLALHSCCPFEHGLTDNSCVVSHSYMSSTCDMDIHWVHSHNNSPLGAEDFTGQAEKIL